MRGDKKSGIREFFTSDAGSNLPSAMADGHNVYQARYTRMVGNNQTIGHQTVFQSGGESSKPSAMAEEKILKDFDFVTCVGHWEAFESDGESSKPSGMGKIAW